MFTLGSWSAAMSRKSDKRRFDVCLVRAKFETVCLGVQAKDEEEAVRLAQEKANELSTGEWALGARPPQIAVLFVDDPTNDPEFDVDEPDWDFHEEVLNERESDFEFVFLMADSGPGHGYVGPIPPTLSQNDLLTADVAMDWIDRLEVVRETSFDRYAKGVVAQAKQPRREDDADESA